MMPSWSASSVGYLLQSWLRDYERIQSAAVLLLYFQIGCALLGSLGALYNGILLIHLILALFALIAIESNSQNLGRTYAVLLGCGFLLDIMWFILFAHEIWNMSSKKYGQLFVFSLRLTLWMQIIGFSLRSLSLLLWIRMYIMGIPSTDSAAYVEADFDVRNAFLNPPTNDIARQNSDSNVVSGSSSSINDLAYYSSLIQDAQEKGYLNEEVKQLISYHLGSASTTEISEIKS